MGISSINWYGILILDLLILKLSINNFLTNKSIALFQSIKWFIDEFIEREKRFLDSGGSFIVPFPIPRVISKTNEYNI